MDRSNTPQYSLRALRKDLHLTQERLAEELGLPPKTYANYERGDKTPSPKNQIKIWEYYRYNGHPNLKLEDLFNYNGESNSKNTALIMARTQLGLSAPEFAKTLRIPYSTYIKYEEGVRERPDLIHLERIISSLQEASLQRKDLDLSHLFPNEETLPRVNKYLFELRKKLRLTRSKIAARLKIPQTTYGRYENMKRYPHERYWKRFSKFLSRYGLKFEEVFPQSTAS